MPSSRASAISEVLSIVKVTRPSTSAGVSPASASACRVASADSCSSERPDSLENSVAPIPAMAALPAQAHRLIATFAVTWSPSGTRPTTSMVSTPSVSSVTSPEKASVS